MVESISCRETTVGDPIREGSEKLGNSGCLIEEDMVKVNVEEALYGSAAVGVDGVNNGELASATGCSAKSVETGCVNRSGVRTSESESLDANGVKSSEILGVDRNGQIVGVNEDGMKTVENGSDGSFESQSASLSSSSSSEDDDSEEEEEEEEEEEDKEKGEIVRDSDGEEMVAWSDAEDDGDGDGGGFGDVISGPIRSKNELEVLPPVPPVTLTLQPYHQILPVGAVLSIMGSQVIVEGVEKHDPLNEGSILWITESRSPLGLVDEIFGPVKNPYYMVRYNSDNEIPAGIQQGTSISFVREFANPVLNDSNLHKKGYDASGEHDEEVSDEAEFSDDEEEAEYRKKLKTTKRGRNDQKQGNRKEDKKFKNRGGTRKNGQPSAPIVAMDVCDISAVQNQRCIPPIAASLDHDSQHSFGQGQGFADGPGIVRPFPQQSQATGFLAPSNVIRMNGMPCQQQHGVVDHNEFPTNGMPWLQENYHQMPLLNRMPSQQQLDPGQRVPSNVVLTGEQANSCAGHASVPWPGYPVQNGFDQISSGMAFPNQHACPPVNVGAQGIMLNGLWNEQNSNLRPPPVTRGNIEASQNFNQGVSFNRGRKPHHRGGGRFSSGRG
ncbi:H/ACA ribonucleoprotein complex non-core subunit NAF1-like [Cornus florida]|uniref:H/ACA ribonucleoprotein complex non-core subunit NAF1-like n=1 Tax=Cornus florida TaxID=4283 RepID=UPI0028999DDA|nr:H/ACA ribonucleoprotein complex non-core subunit NAF1-like [Cornus florida]